MSDEQTAGTLANEGTITAEPVNDGVVDLDASTEVKEETKVAGDGTEQAGEKDAGEAEEARKKLSGAARSKIREQRLLNENSELQRRLEEAERKPAAKTAGEGDEKPPREEDYNGDWFAWQRAMTAFEAGGAARKAIRDEFKTREDSDRSRKQTEIARERSVAHLERVVDAREVIADFDTVMKAMDGVQVRQDVIDEVMSSDKSALLAYHLAKNPDKLQALNAMSGRELAREMGRLEGSVRMPAGNKQTKAPPPLQPLKGGAAGSFDPASASMDDYVAKRKAGWRG